MLFICPACFKREPMRWILSPRQPDPSVYRPGGLNLRSAYRAQNFIFFCNFFTESFPRHVTTINAKLLGPLCPFQRHPTKHQGCLPKRVCQLRSSQEKRQSTKLLVQLSAAKDDDASVISFLYQPRQDNYDLSRVLQSECITPAPRP